MTFFPAFLDLNGRRVAVIGGGKVAERRVRMLLRCGARVLLISPRATRWLSARGRTGEITHRRRTFRSGDLRGARLVLAATDDERVQELIGKRARRAGCLVNVADRPELCDFIMPSVLMRSDLAIAVSTGGKSPALARRIRRQIDRHLGGAPAEFLRWTGPLRRRIMAEVESPARRRRILNRLVDSGLIELIGRGRRTAARRRLAALLREEGIEHRRRH